MLFRSEAVGKVRDGRWGKEEEGERGLCGRVEVRRKGEVKGTMGGGGGVGDMSRTAEPLLPLRLWLFSEPPSLLRSRNAASAFLAFSGPIAHPHASSSDALVRQPLGRTRREPQMPPTPGLSPS